MSGKKKVSKDLLVATEARLGVAIDECIAAWQERWERRPTLRELLHPFEIVLSASPDESVSDPELLLEEPAAPAHVEIAPSSFQIAAAKPWAAGTQRFEATTDRLHVSIEVELVPARAELLVDVTRQAPITTATLSLEDARRLVLARVVPKFESSGGGKVERTTIR